AWSKATIVKNNMFTTNENGVYTILVKDSKNKASVAFVTVTCYASDILPSPKLNTLTNRLDTLTGTAAPNTTLHVTIGDNSYTAAVTASGTFTVQITPAEAFSIITAYVESSGRTSAAVNTNVRKTGPNAVQVNTVHIGDSYVTGTADPNTSIHILIWKTIYVDFGQTQIYKESEYNNPKYNIIEVDITINGTTGEYRAAVPTIKSNMNVFVYSVDRLGVTSKSTKGVPTY
ncbi:MAG TPA: Ig-like domain-containing protein, partial [Mobilitalea sp.]|nr:Ig-like domain-containing protein [Mobilitalea sp.]